MSRISAAQFIKMAGMASTAECAQLNNVACSTVQRAFNRDPEKFLSFVRVGSKAKAEKYRKQLEFQTAMVTMNYVDIDRIKE